LMLGNFLKISFGPYHGLTTGYNLAQFSKAENSSQRQASLRSALRNTSNAPPAPRRTGMNLDSGV
jgi:hypothetical protein